MAITVSHAENCTFIEKQIVEKQVVETMHVQNQNVASQQQVETQAIQYPELLPFVLNDAERSKLAQALALCKDTGQIGILAHTIYLEEILSSEVLRGVDFHRAIIPLLQFETTETAIKQAILKRVK